MTHLGAFESTKIHGSGKDVLGTTNHISRWRHDLELLLQSHLSELRYPIPWHRIESRPGDFDFRWIDGPLEFMRRNGMRPIVDPLHHTSFPDWLKGGFSDPAFPRLYARFLGKLLERYEWLDRYTVVNEPFATTILCSVMGVWHPYEESDAAFVRTSVQMASALTLGANVIRRHNPRIQLVRVDSCERHRALDQASEPWVEFCNHRRFLIDDLATGRMNREHPLWNYCLENGADPDRLKQLTDRAFQMDLFGLDYYPTSEIDWAWSEEKNRADISWPASAPRGFASVAQEYIDRYAKPVMLTETNVRGTVTDRIAWLKYMEEQCESMIQNGCDLRGFCWFPSIDSTDWDQLCAYCRECVDPQGIWWLDSERWTRHASELSMWYAKLASGEATAASLPGYAFLEPLDVHLLGHQKLMSWRPDLAPATELAA